MPVRAPLAAKAKHLNGLNQHTERADNDSQLGLLAADQCPLWVRSSRVLSKALSDALTNELVTKNVCTMKPPPKVGEDDMVIVQDVPAFVAKLALSERLHVPALVALFTGMRLSEVFALRWRYVDLDKAVIQVREALEPTKAHGIRFNQNPRLVAGTSLCLTSLWPRSEITGRPS
jgi:integrase